MLRVSKYVNLSLYIAVFFFFVCFFLVHRSFLSPFCFSVGKNKKKREILDECEGEFCIELSPSVLCINRTVLYIKWMQVAGSIQSFQNRVPCFFGGGVYVKNVSVHDVWTSLPVLFSYMKTLFLHNVFL